ncbi:helix-turn-helix domain-containing protein [Xanthobacter pseudotagetidis]|uniref:helix-turn-helix domain-containing protein n=1 Tax=Xanthobacter pseudotagetidis TaxID=3119911 RepID=UPI0037299502
MTEPRASLVDPPEVAYADWLSAAAPTVGELGWKEHLKVDAVGEDISVAMLDLVPASDAQIAVEGPATFSICVFLDGEGSLSIDGGQPLPITAGMAVVCVTDRLVSGLNTVRGGARMRLVDVRFGPGFLAGLGGPLWRRYGGGLLVDRSVPEIGALMVGFPAPSALLQPAQQIVACAFRSADVRRLYLRAKALEVLAVAVALFQEAGAAPGGRRERDRRKVAEAQRLLQERLHEPWTIARLAREVGLNEKSLKSGFRRQVGASIHAHLVKVRLEAAAEMLSGGQSVTEVALATGFSNLSHFSKTFRRATGLAPREFARRNRET